LDFLFLLKSGLFTSGSGPPAILDEEVHEEDEQADGVEEQDPAQEEFEPAVLLAESFPDIGQALLDQQDELEELEDRDESLEFLGPGEEGAQQIVGIHDSVDARIQQDTPGSITTRTIENNHPPDEEHRGVVINMEKRHLSCALLENHDQRISKIEDLRKIEHPQKASKPNLSWVVRERISSMRKSVQNVRVVENFPRQPGRKDGERQVMDELKNFRGEGREPFHDHVPQKDHGEVGEGNHKGMKRIHDGKIGRQRAPL